MGRRLYVGNLPYTTGEAELQELFSKAGTVETERVERHLIEALAAFVIAFRQLAVRGERELQPQTRQMHYAKGAGRA